MVSLYFVELIRLKEARVIDKKKEDTDTIKDRCERASLTVEAALVMPLFLYLMIAFLYFIQIFTLQEQIQSAITKMGLNLSKSAYVYSDFLSIDEALNFDETIFGTELDIGLHELTNAIIANGVLKGYAKKYLDTDQINDSCIQGGFSDISFSSSKLNEDNCFDIIVRYRVRIPINLFAIDDMRMIQRVRVRTWTGYEVAATYKVEEESVNNESIVYITETGIVYHKSINCSHLKLSIRSVQGIPSSERNNSGGKYYPCEHCGTENMSENAIYYITSSGTKYHSSLSCSGIKRTINEIPITEIGNRLPCKRCGK